MIFLIVGLGLFVIKVDDTLLRDHLVLGQEEWVDTLGRAVAEGIAQSTIDGEKLHARNLLRYVVLTDQTLEYMYVTDFDGLIFAHTFDGGFPNAVAENIRSGKYGPPVRIFLDGNDILEVDLPLIKGMAARLHIGVNQRRIDALIANARDGLIKSVVVVIVIGLVLAFFISSRISRPLYALSQQVRRYGEEGHDVRVEINSGEPDIKKLADLFNEMIATRSQAESELRDSEERFRLLLNSTAEAIYGIDLEGVCTFANPACLTMLGYDSAEELLGRNMHDLIHHTRPDGTPYATQNCPIYRAYQRNEVAHLEDEILWRKDGSSFPVEYWSHPIQRGAAVIGAVVTFLDVTERKRVESQILELNERLEQRVAERTAELRSAQDALLRQERLAALGQLTATVAHEIRNPLGALASSVHVVKRRCAENGIDLTSALGRIDRSIKRCDRIITELLDFTRATGLQLAPTALDSWLSDLLEEQEIPEGITVKTSLRAEGATVRFDPDELRRAIINVVGNACQAMTDGDGEDGATAGDELRIASRVDGERVEIEIADTGPGIPADILPRVLEPLFSTKSFGTGLGLPTVQRIMEQHGGGLEIGSGEDQGTRVVLWMPSSAESEEQQRR
jgi:PAS domain S-box-containing protein